MTKVSGKRVAAIRIALKEEPDLEVWRLAFEHVCRRRYLIGHNDQGTIYATFDFAIRKDKRDQYLDLARAGAPPGSMDQPDRMTSEDVLREALDDDLGPAPWEVSPDEL